MIDLTTLPTNPGCYLFKDSNNNIIYIGKAKSLRKRVSSYFAKKDHDTKTAQLVSQIYDAEFIATSNEIEALILENNLIKKHSPKYNINLKDSKRYAYLELTGEEYPRVIIARSTHSTTKGGKLFGPFVSGSTRDEIMEFVIKSFKIRTCRNLPKRACLRYHLDLCKAPCAGAISKEEYLDDVSAAEKILDGKTLEAISALNAQMKALSKKKEYEQALILRRTAESLKFLDERQNMERNKDYDEDIINFEVKEGRVYLLLFSAIRGVLERKQEFVFEYNKDFLADFLSEFILQYYSDNPIPKEIIVPRQTDKMIAHFLTQKKRSKVKVVVPLKGEKKQLLDLAYKNVELMFFADEQRLTSLRDVLNMEKIPTTIECFDVSHLSGTAMTASMVQFRNAKPNKENYRKFKIRTVEGIDDFAAISEVVYRRYSRIIMEKGEIPDLVIIDGGTGQLNAALASLEKLNLHIPIISIAKEFEEVFVPGSSNPLPMDKKGSALNLIRHIRDEAHRFAISYNRLLRKKKIFSDK